MSTLHSQHVSAAAVITSTSSTQLTEAAAAGIWGTEQNTLSAVAVLSFFTPSSSSSSFS
jgi:hypothetical protein